MLDDDEALAITLSLIAAERQGLSIDPLATAGALAKIERVLPEALRERLQAVRDVVTFHASAAAPRPDGATLRKKGCPMYHAGGGATTEHAIDPYGVVFHAGRWYMVGHCHLRGDVRVFRLDRIGAATLLEESFTRPAGFDSKAHLLEAIARIPDIHEASVLLTLDLAEAQRRCPTGLARFEPAPPYVRLRASVDDLGMLARVLAGLGCPLLIEEPEALREALRTLAVDLLRAADARPDDPQQGREERGSTTHSGADRSAFLVPTASREASIPRR